MAARRTRRKRRPPAINDRGRADEFLDKALRLFAERDYAAVRMQDVARLCGANHSLIYYYYKNKKALFNAAIGHLILTTVSNYEQIAAKHRDDPVALLNDWFDTNITMAPSLRKLMKVLFDYSGPRGRSVHVDTAVTRFYAQERHIISGGIRRGIALGVFRPVNVNKLTAFVSSQIDGIYFGSMMRADVVLRTRIEDLRGILWQLLDYSPAKGKKKRRARR
ncbi:MAG: TetR/AcrR family transcriptional regulator [Dongiaceae bacterium]